MTSPLDDGNRWAVLGVTVLAMTCVGLIPDHVPAAALINESPSLPKGVYLRLRGREPSKGAVVAVPQPASTRRYLAGLGVPAEVLLIKRVAAVGGEVVCRTKGRVTTPVRIVETRLRDGRGVALPAWTGCLTLAADELFLLGDTDSSFDSRYFGPVRRGEIEGVYQEGVTW